MTLSQTQMHQKLEVLSLKKGKVIKKSSLKAFQKGDIKSNVFPKTVTAFFKH